MISPSNSPCLNKTLPHSLIASFHIHRSIISQIIGIQNTENLDHYLPKCLPQNLGVLIVENRFHDFICIENDNWTFLYTVYRKTPYAHFHKQHHDTGQRLGRCENEDTVCSVWSEKHFLHFLLLGCREVLLSRNILWIISVVYVCNFKYFGSHVFKSRNKWAYFYIKFSFI